MPSDNNLQGEFVIEDKGVENKTPDEEKKETTAGKTPPVEGGDKAHFYSNLLIKPQGVSFENQEPDEEIILLIRRDLITNAPWILAAIFLILIPPIISVSSSLFTPFINLSAQTLFILTLFYYLMVFGFILINFTLWYFNIGIVTNKRIVDLDVAGILSKHLSETKINLIEDVSYVQVGAVRSIFNYGDVHMQTAGTLSNFEFDRAPDPSRIVRIIADMIGKSKK